MKSVFVHPVVVVWISGEQNFSLAAERLCLYKSVRKLTSLRLSEENNRLLHSLLSLLFKNCTSHSFPLKNIPVKIQSLRRKHIFHHLQNENDVIWLEFHVWSLVTRRKKNISKQNYKPNTKFEFLVCSRARCDWLWSQKTLLWKRNQINYWNQWVEFLLSVFTCNKNVFFLFSLHLDFLPQKL